MFSDIARLVTPRLFWQALHVEWRSFDAIPHRRMANVFRYYQEHWRVEYMQPDGNAKAGLSRTLDWKIAKSFARGHRCFLYRSPVVIEAMVAKTDLAALYLERQENEVVLFSAMAAKMRVVHRVEPAPAEKSVFEG